MVTGQLAASSGALFTGNAAPVNLTLFNTDTGSDTITLQITPSGGTIQTLLSLTLGPGEQALVNNIALGLKDILSGLATNPNKVNYAVAQPQGQQPEAMQVQILDVNGLPKANAGLSGGGTLGLLSSTTGITAGTTRTQAGATALGAGFNRVDTSTAPAAGALLGDGVKLPASPTTGCSTVVIWNNTANPIQVYGNSSDTVNGVAATVGVALSPNAVEIFFSGAAGSWIYDSGIGTSGQLATMLALDGISAAGANQAGATALTADFNRVITATALQGVKLPASVPGMDVYIQNHSGVQIKVYGNGSDTVDDVAGATGVIQMDRSVVLYTSYAAGAWYTEGLATGYGPTSTLMTEQYSDAVSAAGSSQGTATPLTSMINNVTTVAAGTGVNLPKSAAGLSICVENNGANALTVYPNQGDSDTINGAAATVGVLILPGAVANFNCTLAGVWTVQPASTKSDAYNTNTSTAGTTLTAANVSGAVAEVVLNMTGTLVGAANAQLPTVASLLAVLHATTVGTSFKLRIINSSSGNFAWTVTTNTGWTLNGTMSINQNTWRDFIVTVTGVGGSAAATLQSTGTGTFS